MRDAPRSQRPPFSRRILLGTDEPIFSVLPESVLANLRHPASENALLWNLTYPLAQPYLQLKDLLQLRPLWGTNILHETSRDELTPYFWGFSVSGERLLLLDEVLKEIEGPGPQTEVDLFLVGSRNLILIEAKHLSNLGRCSRYTRRRCPEIHLTSDEHEAACSYWEGTTSNFSLHLDLGSRPAPGETSPSCSRHYQLARTLLLGQSLGTRLGLSFHLWMIVPKVRWKSLERAWLDFSDRVRDHDLWRRMRVLAWEDVRQWQREISKH
jgi:hypothetical protein